MSETQNEIVQVTKMSVSKLGIKKSQRGRIAVFVGKATGIKEKEGPDGRVWSALEGTFQGQNLETGEVFRSSYLFLPEGIHETVQLAVKALPETGGMVKFAIELRRVDAENPIGYSYQAVNLLPMESDTDELGDLTKAIEGKVKQIAAPAPTEQKTGNGKEKAAKAS